MQLYAKRVVQIALGAVALASLGFGSLAFARENENEGRGDDNRSSQAMTIKMSKDDLRKIGSELSVQINDNGKVLVRGAKVTAVNGSTITATTGFGSTVLTWIINTNTATQFVNKGGKNTGLGTMAVGDVLSFNGSLDTTATSLTVAATVVKNWTQTQPLPTPAPGAQDIFQGTLQSMATSTTASTTLVLRIGSTNYTVAVGPTTQVLAANWAPTTFTLANFVIGDTIRVFGTMPSAGTITAIVVRNASR